MSHYVDFHHVEPHQADMHDRLVNWARWCSGRPAYWIQPMFRGYRANAIWYGVDVKVEINPLDAQAVEKAVSALPADHRTAVRWCYVIRSAPRAAAMGIGCTLDTLNKYVRDGRQMLINRIGRNAT